MVVAACLLLGMFAILNADYTDINFLLETGNVDQARDELSRKLAGSFVDWEGAYLSGKLQPDGEMSVSELEKSLLLCKDGCEGILIDLAAAYYSMGYYKKVTDLYKKHDDLLDDKKRSFPVYWFTSMAYMKQGNLDRAEDIIKKAEKASTADALWGDMQRASYQYLKQKKRDSKKRLNNVISAGGTASFMALYNRTYMSGMDKDMDNAFSGFTMLKNNYDDFLGSRELLEILDGGSNISSDGRAEKVAGVRYTIQLGTFADRDEAIELSNRLKKDGWSCFETSKYVDGKPYWILSVGSFPTIESAQKSKKNLENLLSGSFRVEIME
jgi:tetratricopeptide (TPR) repeat protein